MYLKHISVIYVAVNFREKFIGNKNLSKTVHNGLSFLNAEIRRDKLIWKKIVL